MPVLGLPSGLFGRRVMPTASPEPQMAMQQPKLGTLDKIGLAGDILTGRNVTGQRLEQQWEPYQRAAQMQQQQAAQWAMWERQQRWERDNPAPINNDTVNDYNFRVQTLGKQAADDWLKSANDPVVTVTLPGNRVYSGPRSGLADALGSAGGMPAAQAPTAPVGKLKPIGGASPTGSRTFPLR